MSRLSMTVDPDLVEETKRLANAKTKREAIEVALREFVRTRRLQKLADLSGSGLVDMGLDELLEWRRADVREDDD